MGASDAQRSGVYVVACQRCFGAVAVVAANLATCTFCDATLTLE